MLFIRNKEYLKESTQKICDGYAFKLCSGKLEIFDITYKTNKDDYVKNSTAKFGSNITLCLRYEFDEIVGHNVEGLKPKIQEYFKLRNLKPLYLYEDNKDKLELEETTEDTELKEDLTPPIEINRLLEFNDWRSTFYKDINTFVFIIDTELNLTLARWQNFNLDSNEFKAFKDYCANRFDDKSYIFCYIKDTELILEPYLKDMPVSTLKLKEIIKNYFLKEYQIYLNNYS